MNYEHLLSDLRMRLSDPALKYGFIAGNPELMNIFKEFVTVSKENEQIKPFPIHKKITAIQTTIFDNGDDAKARYGCTAEVWSESEINVTSKANFQHKATAMLEPGDAFIKTIKNFKKRSDPNFVGTKAMKHPIDMGFLEFLEEWCQGASPTDMFGIFQVSGHGTGTMYHSDRFVYVPGGINGTNTVAHIMIEREAQSLQKFSTTYSSGKSFPEPNRKSKGKIILQSRLDKIGFSKTWCTE